MRVRAVRRKAIGRLNSLRQSETAMGEANGPVVPLRVAMVGNPNVGKTSLFNRMCGVRAKTANFPGSTVEARVGAAVVGGIELELMAKSVAQ